ncbi:MAG: thrombospondin type 3 repeat-containing protein [Candidatus Poseidoniaceae archaeon]
MRDNAIPATSAKTRPILVALLMLLSTVVTVAGPVQAVGANQTDLGLQGDLPDNMSAVTSNFTAPLAGLAPFSTTDYGQLDVNDDEDWLAINLSANEGVAISLSFNTTYTSSNGSTYTNDFDLTIYDANGTAMDISYAYNPEIVSTNNSATQHNGIVYVQIFRYAGYGWYVLDIWTFSTSSGNGTGGNGTTTPSNCVGNNTLMSDILEPNDTQATATQAATLPVSCSGLSIHSTLDEDLFEIQMISGVTYYANVTFLDISGDIDLSWESSTGAYISGSSSTSDNEAMSYSSAVNQTTYIAVYGWSGATNTYDIDITTNLPGGGQSMESIDVMSTGLTSATLTFSGLSIGTTYNYNYSSAQVLDDGTTYWSNSTNMSFNATATTMVYNVTVSQPLSMESEFYILAYFKDSIGGSIAYDDDYTYIEMVEITSSSSSTGEISLTNLSIGTDYYLEWFVFDIALFSNNFNVSMDVYAALNASTIDTDYMSFNATATSSTTQINWTGPTTLNDHQFVAILSFNNTATNLSTGSGWIGFHYEGFTPQLPTLLIDNYSTSSTSTNNDVTTKGYDLVTGDDYKYQIRITDNNGASVSTLNLTNFTATAPNMNMPLFTYSTPANSGIYCIIVELFSDVNVQLIGDSACFYLTIDDDNDGVANEADNCPNTPTGTTVDQNGCADSQKDTDGDGHNDNLDAFPNDSSQWTDADGDGYGDNMSGNNGDAFPSDSSQWSDIDGDGYGDNSGLNNSDAFPNDPTQWYDADGDGYGDNSGGNNPDEYPLDSTQWKDSDGDGCGDNSAGTNGDHFPNDPTQCSDIDGDGHGDNASGTDPDEFPTDATQWKDSDGDGYGDSQTGNNPDRFPSEPTQWSDADGDGYGDNQAGTNPDAFPSDGTQWSDADGDGYGDNPTGANADAFPSEPTQWSDADNDGYGDIASGLNGDQCLGTPAGSTVDENGCAESQKDDDLDGVNNAMDACPNSPAGSPVDTSGCAASQEDSDADGVMDAYDDCPSTTLGETIDAAGCATSQLDTDSDGIMDDRDQCPNTSAGANVDGFGCASDERDTDSDYVVDSKDICEGTSILEVADEDGCSDSQKDGDGDLITDDIDQCQLTPPDEKEDIDVNGCSDSQRDTDSDQIMDNTDICPATPIGEQPDNEGCADSQKDEDNDDIWNSDDLCPDTGLGEGVDYNGCSDQQKDDDDDGIRNYLDDCPNTVPGWIVEEDGCALNQIDSDKDGVSDADDAFPNDSNETTDTDGDGVPDRWDYYPEDSLKNQQEVAEESGNAMIYGIIAMLVIGIIAAVMYFKRDSLVTQSPFEVANAELDVASEAAFYQADNDKSLPEIVTPSEPIQWEEDGIHWSKDQNDVLSYYDNDTESWLPYQS